MQLHKKSDLMGALASGLCLIHCLITPFIFVAQTCSKVCCSEAPGWWRFIDIIFLIVSLIAIFYSTRQTKSLWVKNSMWVSWMLLCMLILNENLHLVPIGHVVMYIPAFALIALHLFNRKYCVCQADACVLQRPKEVKRSAVSQ